MIDEKKLIENLIPLLNEHGDMYFAGRIIGMIDNQPKLGEWIPCSERLPEHDGFYLTTLDGVLETRITFFSEKHNSFTDCARYVIAWQPLLEPYNP